MKKRRRIALGDLLTIVFENTDTMRFQVQEMARAERMLTDDAIAHEVETYNELIPDAGELSGTLFIELTDRRRCCASGCRSCVGIEYHVYDRGRRRRARVGAASRATRSASPATTSRRPCTT